MYAWEIADQLLRLNVNVETSYFAAQTMRTKVDVKISLHNESMWMHMYVHVVRYIAKKIGENA